MTPKEKAEELIYQFAQIIPPSSYEAYENGVKINFDLENSKNCALISVDEILDDDMYDMSEDLFEKRILYWENVKQEIEKL